MSSTFTKKKIITLKIKKLDKSFDSNKFIFQGRQEMQSLY